MSRSASKTPEPRSRRVFEMGVEADIGEGKGEAVPAPRLLVFCILLSILN